jgi:hypothetical protein
MLCPPHVSSCLKTTPEILKKLPQYLEYLSSIRIGERIGDKIRSCRDHQPETPKPIYGSKGLGFKDQCSGSKDMKLICPPSKDSDPSRPD